MISVNGIRGLVLAAGLCATLGACSSEVSEESDSSESANTTNAQLEGTWVRMPIPGLQIGQAFNSASGQFVQEAEAGRSICVSGLNIKPSGVSNSVTYSVVSSQQQLLKELNVDLGLNVGANVANGPGTSIGGGALKIINSFKSSATSGAFLFRARIVFEIGQAGGVWPRVGPEMPADPTEFVKRCGDRYVAGLRYAAEYTALIQYETSTAEQKRAMEAGVNARTAGPAAVQQAVGGIEARVQANTTNAETRGSVKLTITVDASGFGTQTVPTYLCTTDNYDPVACAARGAMELSRVLTEMNTVTMQLSDIQRGIQDGRITSLEEYLNNTPQLTFPPIQEIAAVNYADKARGVAPTVVDALQESGGLRRQLNAARRMMSDLGALELKLDAVKDEVDAFRQSPTKASFGLYGDPNATATPSADVYSRMPDTQAELLERSVGPASQFDPENPASARGKLRDALLACRNASTRMSPPCEARTPSSGGTVQAALDGARAMLTSYNNSNRVLPAKFEEVGDRGFTEAQDFCKAKGWRLLNSDEAHRMATTLAGRSTWLSPGKGNPAGCIWGAEWIADGHDHGCGVYAFRKKLGVCVPSDGPFNGAQALL